MRLILEIILAFIIGGALFALYLAAKRALTTPVPVPKGAKIYIVVAATGVAAELEQTIEGLLWIRGCAVPAEIMVADCGLDEDAVKVATLICRDNECVTLCTPESIAGEVTKWTRERLFK